jgi:putative PIN family toxin of toxin-antitoxin system
VRILLDTNVLVAALITKDTPPDLLYQAWQRGAFQLVTSEDQINELERVLSYEKLRPYIKPDEARTLLDTIDAMAECVKNLPAVDLSTDPDDNPILATAIKAVVDLIVSGDRPGMLKLGKVEGIPIVTSREALDRLDIQDEGG